jgi:hypothetical protein
MLRRKDDAKDCDLLHLDSGIAADSSAVWCSRGSCCGWLRGWNQLGGHYFRFCHGHRFRPLRTGPGKGRRRSLRRPGSESQRPAWNPALFDSGSDLYRVSGPLHVRDDHIQSSLILRCHADDGRLWPAFLRVEERGIVAAAGMSAVARVQLPAPSVSIPLQFPKTLARLG